MLLSLKLPKTWRQPIFAIALIITASILIYFSTWRSVVEIWLRSDTFAHGFLVAPISLWLLFQRRSEFKNLNPQPSYLALITMAGCGFVWLAAELAQVLVVQQFALVSVLVSGVWAMLGTNVAMRMLFPLAFLFLMVPFGEDFVPYLMEFTASFTVWMLRLTGISVYREGLHFTLTSGNWSVVDACSGIRYLIASFTLGAVFAYLNYINLWKRSLFLIAAIVVPIFANGLRAYMIVMIGHLSDMKLATGVDHIIYGWLFFGLIMLALFYVGSFWQDTPQKTVSSAEESSIVHAHPTNYLLPGLMAGILGLAIWPLAASELKIRQKVDFAIPPVLQEKFTSAAGQPDWGWEPSFKGVMVDAKNIAKDGEHTIVFYAANFGDESGGGELISSQNQLLTQTDKSWHVSRQRLTEIAWPHCKVPVEESQLTSAQRDLLVFRWYRVGSVNTANRYYVKWLQLVKRLTGDASPELMIVLYTDTPHGDYKQAAQRLTKVALACCE